MTVMDRPRSRPALDRARQLIDDWWFAVAGIALIFGSDYKLRLRPVDSAIGGGIDASILLELGLYGMVAAFVLYMFPVLPERRRVPLHVHLALCFAALVVISVIYSPYLVYSAVRAAQFCIVMLLVLAACRHAERAHFHRFAHLYLLFICASVFYGVINPSVPQNARQAGRFTWFAVHPTVSGVLSGLAVVVVVAYLWSPKVPRPGPQWARAVYIVVLLIVGGAMLMAQTRGAIGGAIVGVVALCMMRLGARRLIDLVLSLVVVVGAVALAGGEIVTAYFVRGEETESLTTLNSRTDLWAVAWDAVAQQPLFGFGISASRGIFYADTGLGGGHNAVVNISVELGLVGLATWAAMIVALAVGTVRLARTGPKDAGLDRAMIIAILVFLMFDGIFYEGAGSVANIASTWLFVLVAWLAVAQRTEVELRAGRNSTSIT